MAMLPAQALALLLTTLTVLAPKGANGVDPTFDMAKAARTFWTPTGHRFPSKPFVQAVNDLKLRVVDANGQRRDIVIATFGNEAAFEQVFPLFMDSLSRLKFKRGAPGSQLADDDLARHTLVTVISHDAMRGCTALVDKHGCRCVMYANVGFDEEGTLLFDTKQYYASGFYRIALALDVLSLGADTLLLDCDQVFFRNPIPYFLERRADVMVTVDCFNVEDTEPKEKLPPINDNIGLIYYRATAMVMRSLYNWAFVMMDQAMHGGRPWDQASFRGSVQQLTTSATVRHISISPLRPDRFVIWCSGICGCDLRDVPYYSNGRSARTYPTPASPDCEPALVREWYGFHVPCEGRLEIKHKLMQDKYDMYQRLIGPIDSLSANFTAL